MDVLRDAKEKMGDVPVALEFRHQSWFTEEMREKTLTFMRREGWMHSICDEPQAGIGSVPTVLEATHPEMTMVRFHGCNVGGWVQNNEANWRDVRYLYHYNQQELLKWKAWLLELQEQTREVCVILTIIQEEMPRAMPRNYGTAGFGVQGTVAETVGFVLAIEQA